MTDTDSLDDRNVLARTLFGEARGEGDIGMQAVANVIMNRVARPKWWGTDVRSVCLKPYQFSCWLTSDPNRAKLLAVTADDPTFAAALIIADRAIFRQLPDVTNNATSYYAVGSPTPGWALHKTPCAVIGHHRFFNV